MVRVVAMFLWTLLLFVRGHKAIVRPPQPPPEGADAFSWVFLVPALNEEVTIADSVQRLIELPVARRRVIVIDDGCDDRTAEILAGIEHPDLFVLHRKAPDARQGKAAALNYAYRALRGHTERDDTIVVIVDANGRLRGSAPHFAASHFADPKVGGMQSLVRIYNRQHPLTWLQDVEFSVYGHLFQAGRDHWGTAGMGGNGQFNRLSALDDVANEEGPWPVLVRSTARQLSERGDWAKTEREPISGGGSPATPTASPAAAAAAAPRAPSEESSAGRAPAPARG